MGCGRLGLGMKILRGDVVLVNLEPAVGPEQGKVRPAVIIQNNQSENVIKKCTKIRVSRFVSRPHSHCQPLNQETFCRPIEHL